MQSPKLAGLYTLVLFAAATAAQDVTGTILIKKRLTKRSVTASISVYQRGTTVELGKDSAADPIAFEQSRVVVYLEGPPASSSPTDNTVPAQIQQLDRRFVPDLVVVSAGSTVSFPNMDPIFHNVYSLSKPKSFARIEESNDMGYIIVTRFWRMASRAMPTRLFTLSFWKRKSR